MRLKSKTKLITLLVSLLMIGAATINSTVAFLFTHSGPVENQFNPSQVRTSVDEEITVDENGVNVKEDVTIQNIGDTTAWIRAAVVVTWQDEDGNVYGQMPTDEDYTIVFNLQDQNDPDGKWEKANDGFYYWSKPVPVNENTGVLITSCSPQNPNGITVGSGENAVTYYLTVEILGSGIQTFQGVTDYMTAWNTAMGVTTP